MPPDKHLQSKCRHLLTEYQDVLDLVVKRVTEQVDKEQLVGETSFDYAKKAIRKEAIKEGMKLLLNEINKHASER